MLYYYYYYYYNCKSDVVFGTCCRSSCIETHCMNIYCITVVFKEKNAPHHINSHKHFCDYEELHPINCIPSLLTSCRHRSLTACLVLCSRLELQTTGDLSDLSDLSTPLYNL